MRPIVTEVSGLVDADVETAFRVFASIDLSTILHGRGPLPAVTAVEKQTGAWDGVGQTREILLSDGSRMREELTRVEAPRHFAYVVSEFTGVLRHLVREMRGSWHFDPLQGSPSRSRARWRYEFHCTSAVATLPSLPIVRLLWTPIMQRALELASAQAAASADAG
jgi:hypothetical protein